MRGVLCLHGFTGMPYEVEFLAEALHRRGFAVATPCLDGHGTTPDDLNRTTRSAWRVRVDAELARLAAECESVAVVGQSMGGLLALDAAARGARLSGVVALATPLWLGGVADWLVRGLSTLPLAVLQRLPHRSKGGGSDVCDERVKKENPAYPVLPLAGVVELRRLMIEVSAGLAKVRVPLLVVHGRNDHTAPLACADAIVHGVASRDRAVTIFPRSYHLIACDVERVEVAARVGRFLERVM